ncbi:MAG: phospholipase A [Deltaproteobacteria bacterium]|nr:phospholipase A [Deltaproteobacteria bacterium]
MSRKFFCVTGGIPLAAISLILVFLLVSPGIGSADTPRSLEECARIEDAVERLKCYDELARRKPPETTEDGKAVVKEPPAEDLELPTYLAKLWDLDKESRRGKFAVKFHRSNYILPFTYVEHPNEETIREADPTEELKNPEIKFQLSFKVKLWQDILGKNMDLWFAYTQKSFWQFYNFEDSSPFRETDYEPEILLNFRTNYDLLGLKGRFINVGVSHQSNGQSAPLSRSWNRVVANFGFERENFVLLLNTWLRIPENSEDDDNPDIENYLGYGELWGYYFWKNHRFGVMVRNNFHFDDNRGAVQLEWAFPLIERVSGYIQYFHGYGESLLDYNHSIRRIGIGFILKDWD